MTDKALTLCVMHILREYSDDRHPMTANDVIAKLEELYGLKPDRRSIYSAVKTLQEMHYYISDRSDNGKGYYMGARLLEPEEVQMLTDAVYSFPFLSEWQTSQLVRHIRNLLSVYQREQMKDVSVLMPESRSICKTIFSTLESLDEAIQQKKKVSFYYLECGPDLKFHRKKNNHRADKIYVVNPYGMVYLNEHYYLACVYKGKENPSLYRLDRMEKVKVLTEPVEMRVSQDHLKKMIENATYAHLGDPVQVVFECDNHYLSDVVDRFGNKIKVTELNPHKVRVELTSNRQGMKYWALQYLEHVELIEPADLREEIVQLLQKNRYLAGVGHTSES